MHLIATSHAMRWQTGQMHCTTGELCKLWYIGTHNRSSCNPYVAH